MIKLAIELYNLLYRKHDDNSNCISFRYVMPVSEDWPELEFKFERSGERRWLVTLYWPWPGSVQLYTYEYEVPRASAALPLVAAIGLTYFKHMMAEECQAKSAIQFELDNVTEGTSNG